MSDKDNKKEENKEAKPEAVKLDIHSSKIGVVIKHG